MTRTAAGDDRDLAGHLFGGAVAAQIVIDVFYLIGVGSIDTAEHIIGIMLWLIYNLFHS